VGVRLNLLSTLQALIDDDTAIKLEHIKSIEPKLYRDYIRPVYSPNNISGPYITAYELAGTGATAWHHPIGLWVYILDHNGKPVIDYKPVNPTMVFRPAFPLFKLKNGTYKVASGNH